MKKGFTLVELLSVIVILSMIGIITAPMVLNYINTTKTETYRSNVQTLIEKTTEYVNKNEDNNDYPIEGININSVELNLKNNNFKSGIIKKDEQGRVTAINVYDGEYCANGTKQNLGVEKVENVEECKSVDGSKQNLKIKVVEVTTTKVLIVALGTDKESGIKDYKYCIGNECTDYIEENKYEFKNLKSNQEYEITVTVRNNKYGEYDSDITETTEKIKITTKIIDEPQFKISSSSYASGKEVTIIYPKKEENFIYGYIIAGKEEVINKEEVTLKITENATIKAYIKYGNEEITNEIRIIGIDNEGPEVTVLMEPNWTQNKQIIIETNDNGSGLATNAYSYDGGKNWTSNEKRTFTKNQTIKVVVRDKLGNKTEKYKLCDLKGENCKDVEEIVITTVDNIAPELQNLNGTSTTNSINFNYSIKEEQSGIKKTTCKYGEKSESYTKNATSVTNTNCKIDGLKSNKTYYYQICPTDNAGNVKCTTGTIKTKEIINPVLKFTNTPTTDSNGFLQKQIIGITYTSTNITTPTYYVKTTREGVSNINVTQSCGTETEPTTCTNITSTKTLSPNIWYKVSGNLNVTYDKHNIEEGTIYAITYDEVNYSGQVAGTISKIDASLPNLNVTSITKTTTTMTINYTTSDQETGISSTKCYYGTNTNYGNIIIATNGKCSIIGLTKGTKYYYKVVSTNKLGMENIITGDSTTGTTGIGFTISQTPNGTMYAQSKAVKITYTSTNVTSPTYYFKSTVPVTVASGVVTAICGTADSPGMCSNSSITSLSANTWYKTTNTTPTVTFSANGILYARINDGYTYSSASTQQIAQIDTSSPNLNVTSVTKTTKSMTITYAASDSESGITNTKCYYGMNTNYGNVVIGTNGKCNIIGLASNQTYYYKVETTNGSGLTKVVTGNSVIGSTGIGFGMSRTPSGTPYAQSVIYGITYRSTNVTNPTYYLKTTVTVTSNVNGYSCGTNTDPSTCSTAATNIFVANTWYKVESDPTLIFTANGILYARINDGNTYSSSMTQQISKIDTSAPNLSISSVTKSTTTMTITYAASDAESGITRTNCYYGTSTSYGNTITGSNGKCNISGLAKDQTYYYKVETTNGSGLTRVVTGSSKTGITNIDFTVTQTPTTTTYAQSKTVKITYTSTNVTSPVYYFKTSVQTIVPSGVITHTCGSSDSPGVCISTSTTTLIANAWYKTATTVPIITFTSNGTLYARINDGNSYSSASTQQISEIDIEAPGETTVTYNSGSNTCTWKNNYNITLSSSDNVGISHYEIDHHGDGIPEETTGSKFIPVNGWSSCTIHFRAVDYAGNVGQWTEAHHIHMDTEKPGETTVTYNGGSNTCTWKNNYDMTLSANDNVGISHYEIDWTGDKVADGTEGSTLIPDNGSNSCTNYFRAVDYAGNVGPWTEAHHIHMDTESPGETTVTFNGGSNTCSWKNNYDMTFSSSDNVGISYYQIDHGNDGIPDRTASSNFIPDNGYSTCTDRYRAVDHAGNVGPWTGLHHIHMDTESPKFTKAWWGDVTATVAKLYVQGTDNISLGSVVCPTVTESGLNQNIYLFYGTWDDSQQAFRCDITPATFNHYNQQYSVWLQIYDLAGNGGYYHTATVKIPCKNGYATNGSACGYTCPSGYTLSGSKCIYTINGTYSSCATGSNTCQESCSTVYWCDTCNSGAVPSCISSSHSVRYHTSCNPCGIGANTCKEGYTCPSGYTLSGTKCSKTIDGTAKSCAAAGCK